MLSGRLPSQFPTHPQERTKLVVETPFTVLQMASIRARS
jgi:hypothetical protein